MVKLTYSVINSRYTNGLVGRFTAAIESKFMSAHTSVKYCKDMRRFLDEQAMGLVAIVGVQVGESFRTCWFDCLEIDQLQPWEIEHVLRSKINRRIIEMVWAKDVIKSNFL